MATRQQHLKNSLFPPRQIYFAITAPVINFTGNFYTWLVSLSGALFSLPPLLSRGVQAVSDGARLAGGLRKSSLFYVSRRGPQALVLHREVDLQTHSAGPGNVSTYPGGERAANTSIL